MAPKSTATAGKKAAAAPAAKKTTSTAVAGKKAAPKVAAKKGTARKAVVPVLPKKDPRFERKPKNFTIGNDLAPKRDLTRFVRWPQYVWRQRRVRILQHRLKIPPSINQFAKSLDSHSRTELFKLAQKYKPESKKERTARLKAVAAAKAKKETAGIPHKRNTLRCGLKCVTRLIEQNRAKLVLIAHDVNPMELVVYLPALCRKLNIPYAIVKGKALLGQLVGFKQATAVAFEKINPEDSSAFGKLVESLQTSFNEKYEENRKSWGGLQLGRKARDRNRIKKARADAKKTK